MDLPSPLLRRQLTEVSGSDKSRPSPTLFGTSGSGSGLVALRPFVSIPENDEAVSQLKRGWQRKTRYLITWRLNSLLDPEAARSRLAHGSEILLRAHHGRSGRSVPEVADHSRVSSLDGGQHSGQQSGSGDRDGAVRRGRAAKGNRASSLRPAGIQTTGENLAISQVSAGSLCDPDTTTCAFAYLVISGDRADPTPRSVLNAILTRFPVPYCSAVNTANGTARST